MDLMQTLTIVLIFLVFAILALAFIYWQMSTKNKSNEKAGDNSHNENSENIQKSGSGYTKLSVFDFMEFDKIEDNMIVQNNGQRYLMGIECEGINYDLMSEVEKTSVEQGFIQFLNTLNHPIQLYTQTRTINIGTSIENYNRKIDEVKEELERKQNQYNKMIQAGTYDSRDLQEVRMEILRQQNLYDYGKDIVSNIETMSLNKNVLRKHYYIIIPYYTSELGNNFLDEDEKKSMVFSELYTRAQSIIRTLFACSMKCKVMDSNDLAELLYVAYNRDESEIYGIDKALEAGYGELYSTAPDVLDKRMEAINKEIQEKAMQLAREKVEEIKSEKQKIIEKKEKSFDQLVEELATVIIKENKNYVGKEVAEKAVKRIKKQDTKEEEVEADVKEEKKTRRVGRPRKNA
ncbi:MAG: hypothetical protein IJE59_01830 [Clostridia bacterium]|nr:hypothetical protein [Clostridia bacterium]